MRELVRLGALAFAICLCLPAQEWRDLFNGRDLDGWQERGDGIWLVLDGVLVGQRKHTNPRSFEFPLTNERFRAWFYNQAWLYTLDEFDEYDLHLEWWLPHGGNSGVSIRDQTRAEHGISIPADWKRTPSKVGYEIQISNGYPDKNPSGSIYGLARAKAGSLKADQWNAFEIESRKDWIRVKLNGTLVAEHAGDPKRPKTGPIGLQLHDQMSLAMFRNIRIRVLP